MLPGVAFINVNPSEIGRLIVMNMVGKRIGLSIMVAGLVLILTGCTEIQFLDKDTAEASSEQAISISEVEVYITKEGEMQQKIEAAKAQLFEVQCKIEMMEIAITFYSHDKPVGVINSDKGIFYLAEDKEKRVNKNDFVLTNNVRYTAEDGTMLVTKEIRWNSILERIISPFAFTQRKAMPEGILLFTGKGFETDKTFSNWVYKGGEMTILPRSDTQEE